MTAPVGSASLQNPFQSAFKTGSGTAALEAQLAAYRRKLADCLDCASSRTPQGQAEIQQLSAQIGDVQARIEKIRDEPSSTPPVPAAASAQTTPGPAQGGLLDVYA